MLRCFRLQGPSTRCLRSFTSLNSNLNHLFEQKVQLGKTLPELNDNQVRKAIKLGTKLRILLAAKTENVRTVQTSNRWTMHYRKAWYV